MKRRRRLRLELPLFVTLALTAVAPAALAQQAFTDWHDDATGQGSDDALYEALRAEREQYISRVDEEGVAALLDALREEARRLTPDAALRDASDAENIAKLVALIDLARNTAPPTEAVAAAMDEPTFDSDLTRVAEDIVIEVGTDPVTNPFGGMGQISSGADPDRGNYAVGGGANRIVTPRDSTSSVDKAIWRLGLIAGAVIGEANIPLMEATQQAVSDARVRWDAFMANVVADQFVWETMINGAAARRLPRIAGTLTTPPQYQLRILHPTPVLSYSTEGGAQADLRLAVEVLGIRRFASETYEPQAGLSLVAIVPGEREEDTGWGLLFTLKRFSFGLARQEFDNGEDVTGLVFGLDLAAELGNDQSGLRVALDGRLACLEATIDARTEPRDETKQSVMREACAMVD